MPLFGTMAKQARHQRKDKLGFPPISRRTVHQACGACARQRFVCLSTSCSRRARLLSELPRRERLKQLLEPQIEQQRHGHPVDNAADDQLRVHKKDLLEPMG